MGVFGLALGEPPHPFVEVDLGASPPQFSQYIFPVPGYSYNNNGGGLNVIINTTYVQNFAALLATNTISGYLRDCRMHVDYSTATFSATMQLIVSLGGLIVWYVGGHDVLAGTMSLGSLIAFLAYLAMFYTPLALSLIHISEPTRH